VKREDTALGHEYNDTAHASTKNAEGWGTFSLGSVIAERWVTCLAIDPLKSKSTSSGPPAKHRGRKNIRCVRL
jgi:hypothetical protein